MVFVLNTSWKLLLQGKCCFPNFKKVLPILVYNVECKKNVTNSSRRIWIKKHREEDLDIPTGCHDGTEICEHLVTLILNKKSPIRQEQNNVTLYRDDGLGILSRTQYWKK